MSEWIKIEDRLPDNPNRKFIVWCERCYAASYMHVGVYREGGWCVDDPSINGITGFVTHYMPLPEPPKD